ncbi:hypothetical protein GCM10010331_14530 [Streptomyces xanthochromogenes]|nr:hypothetical protein GCM10010331_14530 [Streptomyces xanthochromogenes]
MKPKASSSRRIAAFASSYRTVGYMLMPITPSGPPPGRAADCDLDLSVAPGTDSAPCAQGAPGPAARRGAPTQRDAKVLQRAMSPVW